VAIGRNAKNKLFSLLVIVQRRRNPMTTSDCSRSTRSPALKESGSNATIGAVACMIGALFAGSTVVTPLYVMYKQQFGFSQISLTLIYAVYVVGNALPVIGIGVISTLAGPNVASLAFAATIAAFALIALFFGARYLPK
jgi:hypothetical protein